MSDFPQSRLMNNLETIAEDYKSLNTLMFCANAALLSTFLCVVIGYFATPLLRRFLSRYHSQTIPRCAKSVIYADLHAQHHTSPQLDSPHRDHAPPSSPSHLHQPSPHKHTPTKHFLERNYTPDFESNSDQQARMLWPAFMPSSINPSDFRQLWRNSSPSPPPPYIPPEPSSSHSHSQSSPPSASSMRTGPAMLPLPERRKTTTAALNIGITVKKERTPSPPLSALPFAPSTPPSIYAPRTPPRPPPSLNDWSEVNSFSGTDSRSPSGTLGGGGGGWSASRRRVLRGFTPSNLDKEERDVFTGMVWGKQDVMGSISEKVVRTPDRRRSSGREMEMGGAWSS